MDTVLEKQGWISKSHTYFKECLALSNMHEEDNSPIRALFLRGCAFRGWLQSNDTTEEPQYAMWPISGELVCFQLSRLPLSCAWNETILTCPVYPQAPLTHHMFPRQFWQSHKSNVYSWHKRIYYKSAVIWQTFNSVWQWVWGTHLGNRSLYGHRVDSGHWWVPSLRASWKGRSNAKEK